MRQPKIIIRDEATRQRAIGLLSALSLEKPWDVSVTLHKSKRSLDQNRLYHLWVGIIAEETGNSHDDTHEAMKQMFLPPRFVNFNGQMREVRPSTTSLDTKAMSEFLNKVEAFAGSTLALVLPHPEDLGR